ncbi:MAG: MarR family transcriptional regulator [Oscillospiraceae bacterium]|jgi:DNA-binding MarR family transcriptional regulator|nr:MarR family transcriptional regulator [Oscillospiraceae bacterium]
MKNLSQAEKLFILFQRGAILVGRGQPPHSGVGHGQGYILSLLAESQLSQKELLEKLGVRAGSLSELLGKLEHAGFVTRSKDENDNRVVNVEITESGRKFAAEHSGKRVETAESLFAALSDDEKTTLIGLLEKLHDSWRQEREAHDFEHRGGGRRGGFKPGRGFHSPHFGGFPPPPPPRYDGHGFGGSGFEHPRPFADFHSETGKHHGNGKHSHGEEITDPALKAHLETLNCGECDKNCKLSAPHCGKGTKKQQAASADFAKLS